MLLQGKPLICISTDADSKSDPKKRVLNNNLVYARAVEAADGIPLAGSECCVEEMAELCDGLLLSGGADVDPDLYGEEPLNDTVKPDPLRSAFEAPLFRAFLARKKPILGICRGCQVINVMLGGTLYQDLTSQLGFVHSNGEIRHPLFAEEGSVLAQLFGREFRVNSTHHQAVKDLAPGLHVTGRSIEGIVEAFEHDTLPILATQFHPERLTGALWDDRTPDFAPYFRHFIEMVLQDAQRRQG